LSDRLCSNTYTYIYIVLRGVKVKWITKRLYHRRTVIKRNAIRTRCILWSSDRENSVICFWENQRKTQSLLCTAVYNDISFKGCIQYTCVPRMVYIGILLLLQGVYYIMIASVPERKSSLRRTCSRSVQSTVPGGSFLSYIYTYSRIIMLNICFDLKLSAAHAVSLCAHPGLQGWRPTKPYRLQDHTIRLFIGHRSQYIYIAA